MKYVILIILCLQLVIKISSKLQRITKDFAFIFSNLPRPVPGSTLINHEDN